MAEVITTKSVKHSSANGSGRSNSVGMAKLKGALAGSGRS